MAGNMNLSAAVTKREVTISVTMDEETARVLMDAAFSAATLLRVPKNTEVMMMLSDEIERALDESS